MTPAGPDLSADVVVYAATSAGVCAAVAAARLGASVVLLEPGRHVGGMTSGGLGYTDVGDPRALAGPAVRFRSAVAAYYGVRVGRYAGPEPHVAEEILTQWLVEADVPLEFDAAVARCTLSGNRIRSLHLTDGRAVTARVFIDASYEGDLLAAAGVPYAVGRDGVNAYGERLAGRQEPVPGKHNFPGWVSPFADDAEGVDEGVLLPGVKPPPMAPVGDGDGGVMAYQYRVCLTTAADRIPLRELPDPDPGSWELGRRLFHHWRRAGYEPHAGDLLGLEPNLPGDKCDANSLGPFSLNVLDGSAWAYPEADRETRSLIVRHHRRHTQGFLRFLVEDPAVPARVRAELSRWGLPIDEFADTGHVPHQLYVREARRMLGAHVLTAHDLLRARRFPDAVALGSYHLDVREVQRSWRWSYEHPRPRAMVVTEGYLSVPVPVYQIPYRALVPRVEECDNLLVPVCVSASHLAFSSLRMEVQYQMLGEVAGTAAALAAGADRAVQEVPAALTRVLPGDRSASPRTRPGWPRVSGTD